MFLRFLGCSSFFLRIFDVEAISFPLSKILNAKMHARMIWRCLRIVFSFSLNFSFCQNEKPFSFDQNENTATFTENLKLFQWFKMFQEDGLMGELMPLRKALATSQSACLGPTCRLKLEAQACRSIAGLEDCCQVRLEHEQYQASFRVA
jgi:hypothetical protein